MEKQQPPTKAARRPKPLTVHDLARTGDLVGLENLLLADPSLLNARSPAMDQTPLHASAGGNRVEVVKFLFEWQGEEKVELEAKNTLGETPLHMAVKNGRNEAARLLLAHGASTEAQDINGGTPLHLAVWYSIKSKSRDFSIVKTLLEYKADCSAKDNDGKTPMDYALEDQASGKLRELFQRHIDEVAEASKMKDLKAALSYIVGTICKGDQTPLHIASAKNKAGIVKSLLELQGEKKVELEAKNTLGETPLHVAAKNGSNEAARLLLAHGASTEARENNGWTPLHLAVQDSIRFKSEDFPIVKTLLEYNADCNAKDNVGLTPMNYVVQHRGNEKLRDLLWQHLQEVARTTAETSQAKMEDPEEVAGTTAETSKAKMEDVEEVAGTTAEESKAKMEEREEVVGTIAEASKAKMEELEVAKTIAEASKAKMEELEVAKTIAEASKATMEELEAELSNIVGLEEVKVQLRKWAKGMILDEKRRAFRLKVGVRKLPHMAFLGNSGTGKTMVARILGRLLHLVGVLPTDRVTEVQRTDLVGEFVGHTGPKTRNKIKEADGGILFIDEAYRLIPMQKADDKDYGLEALEEIMSVMDSGKVVVIFAGYSEPMKRVIASNEGFCRRVTKFFHFSDFNCDELAKIVHVKMRTRDEESVLFGFNLHSECSVEAIGELIEKETSEEKRKEINGGLAEIMLVNARENLDYRLDVECRDIEELCTIRLEDLEAGLKLL